MARWRSEAIERLPELRDTIAKAESIMSLWIELHLTFQNAYREPKNDELIARIYSYADWCLTAPRNDGKTNRDSPRVPSETGGCPRLSCQSLRRDVSGAQIRRELVRMCAVSTAAIS